ncbi:MAG: type II secretion system protein [Planctomycetota bacterium]
MKKKGFTLVELMLVVLIVAILAAVLVPMIIGKINKAKWSEANASAGTVRTAVRVYYAENPGAAVLLTGVTLDDLTLQDTLGFSASDLTGTYFGPQDYTIDSVNAEGIAIIIVTSRGINGGPPNGDSRTLEEDGEFVDSTPAAP